MDLGSSPKKILSDFFKYFFFLKIPLRMLTGDQLLNKANDC